MGNIIRANHAGINSSIHNHLSYINEGENSYKVWFERHHLSFSIINTRQTIVFGL